VPYVDDETNFGCEYTRNKIRQNVLPALEDAVGGASASIFRFSRLAAEDEEYFDNLIGNMSLLRQTPYGVEIKFCNEKVVFRRAALKALYLLRSDVHDYTLEQLNGLYNLQYLGAGKKFEFLKFTAYSEDGKIAITNSSRDIPAPIEFESFLKGEKNSFFGESLEVEKELVGGCDGYKILMCDRDKIPKGACVRTMQQGDKFKKFGGGTKPLGDFFTDRKIPIRVRKNIPLVCVGSDVLVVCGVEISDGVKIDENTKNIVHIKCRDYKKI
jgi:tRNA(Ile)-lysidine synthase